MRSYRAVTEDWSICVYRKCEKNVLLFCVCLLLSFIWVRQHAHNAMPSHGSEYNERKACSSGSHTHTYTHLLHLPYFHSVRTFPHYILLVFECIEMIRCYMAKMFMWEPVVYVCVCVLLLFVHLAAHVVRVTVIYACVCIGIWLKVFCAQMYSFLFLVFIAVCCVFFFCFIHLIRALSAHKNPCYVCNPAKKQHISYIPIVRVGMHDVDSVWSCIRRALSMCENPKICMCVQYFAHHSDDDEIMGRKAGWIRLHARGVFFNDEKLLINIL